MILYRTIARAKVKEPATSSVEETKKKFRWCPSRPPSPAPPHHQAPRRSTRLLAKHF